MKVPDYITSGAIVCPTQDKKGYYGIMVLYDGYPTTPHHKQALGDNAKFYNSSNIHEIMSIKILIQLYPTVKETQHKLDRELPIWKEHDSTAWKIWNDESLEIAKNGPIYGTTIEDVIKDFPNIRYVYILIEDKWYVDILDNRMPNYPMYNVPLEDAQEMYRKHKGFSKE